MGGSPGRPAAVGLGTRGTAMPCCGSIPPSTHWCSPSTAAHLEVLLEGLRAGMEQRVRDPQQTLHQSPVVQDLSGEQLEDRGVWVPGPAEMLAGPCTRDFGVSAGAQQSGDTDLVSLGTSGHPFGVRVPVGRTPAQSSAADPPSDRRAASGGPGHPAAPGRSPPAARRAQPSGRAGSPGSARTAAERRAVSRAGREGTHTGAASPGHRPPLHLLLVCAGPSAITWRIPSSHVPPDPTPPSPTAGSNAAGLGSGEGSRG